MAKVGDDYTWKGDRNLTIYDDHFEKSFINRVIVSSYILDKNSVPRFVSKVVITL